MFLYKYKIIHVHILYIVLVYDFSFLQVGLSTFLHLVYINYLYDDLFINIFLT